MHLFKTAKEKNLDGYGGTMTVSLAAAGINRQRISIEGNSICFKRTADRVWKMCHPHDLSIFAGSSENVIMLELKKSFVLYTFALTNVP